jgi:hypothetical protein
MRLSPVSPPRGGDPMTYFELKDLISASTGLEKDALHIHAAIFIYLAAMAIFRRGRASGLPWLTVLLLELANEAYDVRHNWVDGADWALSGSAKDLWNTMLWPTVLLLIGRHTRWFERSPAPSAEAVPE